MADSRQTCRRTIAAGVLLICSAATSDASWTSHGPYYKSIRATAVSPQHPATVFAGAFGWGVFKSTDAGNSWSNAQTGLVSTYIRALLPLSDSTLFAGANDGVYKSSDGGATWTAVLTTPHSVRALAFDNHTNNIYAGSFGSGLYKTTNMGLTWSAISVTDPTGTDPPRTLSHIESLAMFGRDSIYAGGSILDIPTGQGGSLFVSTDGGGSWFQVQYPSPAIRSSVHTVAVSPTNPANALIIGTATKGVYLSTDAGTTWTNIDQVASPGLSLPDVHINAVGFTATHYFAATDSTAGLYAYSLANPAAGWSPGTGTPGPPVSPNSITIDPTNASIMYAGTEGRAVYKSTNAGASWQAANIGMLGTAGRSLAFNGDGKLLLGTDFGDGIWISADSGRSWTRIDSLATVDPITSFAITNSPLTIYAGAFGTGVHKSTDGGLTWHITDSTTINHFVRPVIADPGNLNVVYAGTNNGVYKTTNGGSSWASLNAGVPPNTSVRSMAMDPGNSSNLYYGTDSSYLFKSTDGGVSWTNITNAGGFLVQDKNIRCISINGLAPSTLYAGGDSGRIYKSTNSGNNWVLLSKLPTDFSVRHILIDPNDAATFFAATFGSGVFLSVDSGGHWSPWNDSLRDLGLYTLASGHNTPLTLLAGSKMNGVFTNSYAAPIDHPPVISPIGNKTISPNQQLAFTVSATDPDSTIPHLSATGLPAGASFSDSLNGRGGFRWTPATNQTGNYSVTFIASDGILADSQTITIAVVIQAPILAFIGNKSVLTGHLLSFTVSATDPDSTIPSLSVSGLPPGAGFVDSSNGHGLFTWTPTGSQVGTYALTFFASHGGLSDSQQVSVSVLDSTGSVVDNFPVQSGWNMVSVPASAGDERRTTLFPSAVSQAYGFAGTYVVRDTLSLGQGYWLKFSQDQTASIGGTNVTRDSLTVLGNWNMIGSLSSAIPASQVRALPPVTVTSNIFGYSSALGYFVTDTLRPGKGYWARVNQAGKIVLGGGPSQSASALEKFAARGTGNQTVPRSAITFTDAKGRERTIYVSEAGQSLPAEQYELPPVPPSGEFDVRYSTQSSLAVVNDPGKVSRIPIGISGGGTSLKIRWNMIYSRMTYLLEMSMEDAPPRLYELAGGSGSVTVSGPVAGAALEAVPGSGGALPGRYLLEQNFPNPFNPATLIRYYLPARSLVQLQVFDVLGRQMVKLVDMLQDAGYHAQTWNAAPGASGVYFYRLRVIDPADASLRYQQTRKMYLLR